MATAVCAPSYHKVGYFSVTARGMTVLQSCDRRGFHLHEDAGLYECANHAMLDAANACAFVDLRR